MEARDLALVLASDAASSGDEQYPLDKIRMQKAAFLVSMRGGEALRLYEFEPYNWGPYSGELNSDLRALTGADLISVESVSGSRHGAFRTTPLGEHAANAVWANLTEQQRTFIRAVRKFVTSRSFQRLLRDVYAGYPEYATKSQFAG